MTNFIKDNTPLRPAKSDYRVSASVSTDQKVAAVDWNEFRSALVDIQSFIRGADWLGLTENASNPVPAGVTNYIWLKSDGSLWLTNEGATSQIAPAGAGAGVGTINNGATNKLPKYVGVNTIDDSSITDDGTNVTVPGLITDSVRFPFGFALNLSAGQVDNWDPGIGDTSLPVTCGFGGTILTGMVATRHAKGVMVLLGNAMPGPELLIKHMSTASLADNRILCPGERDLRIPSGGGAVMQSFGPANGVHGWRIVGVCSTSFQTMDAFSAIVGRLNRGGTTLSGAVITPPALAAGANHNWLPTGFVNAGRIRLVPGAASTLSGMAGILDGVAVGDEKVVEVFGPMTFKHQDAGSTAERRFFLPNSTDLVFPGVGSVTFVYENNQYWWPISVCK